MSLDDLYMMGKLNSEIFDKSQKSNAGDLNKIEIRSRASRASTAKPHSRYSVAKISTKSLTSSQVMLKRQLVIKGLDSKPKDRSRFNENTT